MYDLPMAALSGHGLDNLPWRKNAREDRPRDDGLAPVIKGDEGPERFPGMVTIVTAALLGNARDGLIENDLEHERFFENATESRTRCRGFRAGAGAAFRGRSMSGESMCA